jgi:methionyl-tRNA formyltransferase
MTSVLFLGKQGDAHVDRALRYSLMAFDQVVACLGRWGDPPPTVFDGWSGDYIVSYLSRWRVPEPALHRARIAAINFHPAPPEYPGIGCNNFALYEEAPTYGVTCHHMVARVDSGPIIAVKRFPLFASDDVASLLARTYDIQLVLFYEIANVMRENASLPVSTEQWTRKPFTRKQFDQLTRITPEMSAQEIARRVRATTFGSWRPMLEVAGHTFEWKDRK